MNERIRELAQQASKDDSDGYPVTLEYNKRFADKFAQLIIKECIDAAEEAQADFYVVTNIKWRFGLAEFQNERTN